MTRTNGDAHIRQATATDIPLLVSYGQRYYDESVYAEWLTFSRRRVTDWFGYLVDSHDAVVFLTDGGMAAGAFNGLFMTEDPNANELLWWVAPEQRGKGRGRALRQALEDWAAKRGAKLMTLSTLGPVPEGYTLLERSYIRRM